MNKLFSFCILLAMWMTFISCGDDDTTTTAATTTSTTSTTTDSSLLPSQVGTNIGR